MFSLICGDVFSKDHQSIHVRVGGLGFEVWAPLDVIAEVKIGEEVKLFTHTHLRENLIQLFGFESEDNKKLFLTLIGVNGIGPKVGLNILSAAPKDQIIQWIRSADIDGLCTLPKIGKKTAQQIILSLKDQDWIQATQIEGSNNTTQYEQLTKALVNLGYRREDVEQVISKLGMDLNFEDSFRQSLSLLSGV